MNNPIYDVSYFINKFSAIPDELWCISEYTDGEGRFCALGHCGWVKEDLVISEDDPGWLLNRLFWEHHRCAVGNVNDGYNELYQQPTPKARILAALADIKAKQAQPAPVVPHAPAKPVQAQECVHMFCGGLCLYCCHPEPVKQMEVVL